MKSSFVQVKQTFTCQKKFSWMNKSGLDRDDFSYYKMSSLDSAGTERRQGKATVVLIVQFVFAAGEVYCSGPEASSCLKSWP